MEKEESKMNELEFKIVKDLLERMDRARNILTDGNPTPNCNWGMLDTSLDRENLNILKEEKMNFELEEAIDHVDYILENSNCYTTLKLVSALYKIIQLQQQQINELLKDN